MRLKKHVTCNTMAQFISSWLRISGDLQIHSEVFSVVGIPWGQKQHRLVWAPCQPLGLVAGQNVLTCLWKSIKQWVRPPAPPLASCVSLVILLLPLQCLRQCGEIPKDFHTQPKTILVNITQQWRKNIIFSCRGKKSRMGTRQRVDYLFSSAYWTHTTQYVCLLQIIKDQNAWR